VFHELLGLLLGDCVAEELDGLVDGCSHVADQLLVGEVQDVSVVRKVLVVEVLKITKNFIQNSEKNSKIQTHMFTDRTPPCLISENLLEVLFNGADIVVELVLAQIIQRNGDILDVTHDMDDFGLDRPDLIREELHG
jgi:hypothetical protein